MTKRVYIVVLDISQLGGIERFARTLCNALVSMNIDASIVSLFCSDNDYLPSEFERILIRKKFTGSFSTDFFKACLKSRKILARGKILHTYNNIFVITSAIMVSSLRDTIYTEHSAYAAVRWPVRIILNFLLKFVPYIICQTDSSLVTYRKRLTKNAVIKIPPYYVSNYFERPHTCSSSLRQYNNERISIAFAGRLEEEKGIVDFISFLHHFSMYNCNIDAYIFGSGSYSETLVNLRRESNLSVRLHFEGYVSDLEERFRYIDFVFIVSKSESFSIVGLEALNSGSGIVYYNDLIGPREFCTENNSVALDRNSKFDALVLFEEMRKRKSTDGFRLACHNSVSHYTEKNFIRSWLQVLGDD
jgi:glycosyltransferase involved in cell wall biosynthesis